MAAERGRAVISNVAEHEKACSSSDFERQEAPRYMRHVLNIKVEHGTFDVISMSDPPLVLDSQTPRSVGPSKG